MNKLIHRGYFKEIFRQLRVAGFVSGGILILSRFTSVLNIIMGLNMPYIPSGSAMASQMREYIYIMGLIFPFIAFGWMNKRSSSDFYHAIPITRTQIYFSTVLAVLSWMFISLTAYALINVGFYLLIGLPYNYLLFLFVYINMMIAAAEVVGAVSLACAISGTRFVNFFAAAVILFMPRLMFTILAGFVQAYSDGTFMAGTISFLFDPSYNIIAAPYADLASSLIRGMYVDYAKAGAMIYTFVYSVLLLILGWIAFKKRKSEAAGIPTTSKAFQSIIRICFGLPLILILDLIIIESGFGSVIIAAPIMIFFAFVFYCLYELISTKSAKKMARSMPLFLVCIGIGVIYLVLPGLISNHESSIKAEEKNIRSFTFWQNQAEGNLLLIEYSDNDGSFADLIGDKTVYNDPESIKIIARGLERDYAENGIWVTVNRKFGKTITRLAHLTPDELNKLEEIKSRNETYTRALNEFPFGHNYFYCEGLKLKEAKELGRIFMEEYNSLPQEKKLIVQNSFYNEALSNSDLTILLNVCGTYGVDSYLNSYYLSEVTPNSLRYYISTVNSHTGEDTVTMLDSIYERSRSEKIEDIDSFYSIQIDGDVSFMIDRYSVQYYNGNSEFDLSEEYKEAIEILSRAELSNDVDFNIKVMILPENSLGLFKKDPEAFMKLSEEDMTRLTQLAEIINNSYDHYDEYDDGFTDVEPTE